MFREFDLEDLAAGVLGGFNDDERVFEEQFNESGVALMDDQFERRAREIGRKTPPTQPVSVFPAFKGPWSGNNQLGIEQPFAPNANNEQTILKLDEWGFPEVWTVMLGSNFNPLDVNNTSPSFTGDFYVNCLAVIGSGGATQEVSMDWMNGTVFRAPMNALNIVARFQNSARAPSDLRLRVTISRGALPGFPPQNTRPFFAAAGTTSDNVPVPLFAKSFRVVGGFGDDFSPAPGAVFAANNQFRFKSQVTNSLYLASLDAADALQFMSNGIPLPRFTRWLAYRNNGGSDVGGQYIFDLAL